MPYTVREVCPRCGRAFTYPGGEGNPDCPLCWIGDLTEAAAAAENAKDDS